MTTVNRQESTAQVEAVETKRLHGCLNDKKKLSMKKVRLSNATRGMLITTMSSTMTSFCAFSHQFNSTPQPPCVLEFSFIVHAAEN